MPKPQNPISPEETAESTDLTAIQQGGDVAEVENALLALDDQFTHEDAQDLQDESSYLPYMRLIQGDNKYKEPPFEFQDGDFSLHPNKNEAMRLGNELDIMFVTWRPLAMNFTSGRPQGTTDRHSEEFKDWRQRAESKDQDVRSGFQWGYETLVWLPELATFATFWLNTPSLRRFGRYELIGTKTQAPLLRQRLTMWAEKITDEQDEGGRKKTYRYWVIKHAPCNTPFANMPDMETLNAVVSNFKDGRQLSQSDNGDGSGVQVDEDGEDNTEVVR